MAERVQHPVTDRVPQSQTILNRRPEMDPGIDPALGRLGRRIGKAVELARNPGLGDTRRREGLFAEEVGQNCGRRGAERGMPGDIVRMVRGREKRKPARVGHGGAFPSVSASRIAVTGRQEP